MRNLLFAVLIGAFLMVGTANADTGAWIASGSNGYDYGGTGWLTTFHISNQTASNVATTVEFFTFETGVSLGSTTRAMKANSLWAFNTGTIGTITSAAMVDAKKGLVVFGVGINATASMFFNPTASGFNFNWTD